ncbi:MAG: PDZ domain-containing protein [Saprospiraceae bacterium]|nr:PDZ domain-containing protein [Saprospiraceae bacterium]
MKEKLYFEHCPKSGKATTGLTKHFVVTLNFKKKELYLARIEGTEEMEPDKSFGFDLNKKEGRVYVSRIYRGLSADKSGLRLNDEVVTINGKDMVGQSYCDFYDMTRELFKTNEAITLQIKREDGIELVEIVKSDLHFAR